MQNLKIKDIFNQVLNGASTGIVIGLIPSAILGALTRSWLSTPGFLADFAGSIQAFQFAVPFLVGLFAALQLNMKGMETAALAGAAFLGSGAARLVDGTWALKGTGDLINTIITVFIAAIFIKLYNNRWQSLNIVVLPLLGGILPGFIGRLILPLVSQLTLLLGQGIAHLTEIQPLIMAILIAIAFAIIIVTPLSSVAIAYAVSISGLAAGAANLGIVAVVFTFLYASSRVNSNGITFSLLFAGPKLFMANYLQNLKMTLPIVINAGVVGLFGYLFNIQGTTESAGFGITGLSGPINAYYFMDGNVVVNILVLCLTYVVVPLAISIITHQTFTRMGIYDESIYVYHAPEH
ncbi:MULTISPECIES: PTS transporter subunit IIC [Aerococcus]|uniref:PTS transporter subunit IIC n=1 Tax=Aerococcus TaxID=1375 RepID=UPI000DCBAD4D|nr:MULTISPECIES: PTS sugar transporter subunit IIC [Aerococcus]MDL5183564.1 PTS sugar transporter subunit IIC [Aerococcus mictus]MDK6291383.1 PTS sugar transporter subunit IIC [Aerococcus urinae]MDK6375823.1 PTS sugar transporter subunit IIC [Aerococcus urinae]MDK6420633.1 PTS sugar transporter subunit IIC [Aerococcus urinae]MDK8075478.1 PTS sugar transporter subunit IIC [Aerococcus urinae]